MSVAQMFPKTVEEFMEEYKMVDKDHVYSNGIEYVPIFRMKQWFEHISSVQPRRGKWAGKGDSEGFGIFICDNCGKFAMMEYDFCPNCGADMRQRGEQTG